MSDDRIDWADLMVFATMARGFEAAESEKLKDGELAKLDAYPPVREMHDVIASALRSAYAAGQRDGGLEATDVLLDALERARLRDPEVTP
jgi:hypothetical protein